MRIRSGAGDSTTCPSERTTSHMTQGATGTGTNTDQGRENTSGGHKAAYGAGSLRNGIQGIGAIR